MELASCGLGKPCGLILMFAHVGQAMVQDNHDDRLVQHDLQRLEDGILMVLVESDPSVRCSMAAAIRSTGIDIMSTGDRLDQVGRDILDKAHLALVDCPVDDWERCLESLVSLDDQFRRKVVLMSVSREARRMVGLLGLAGFLEKPMRFPEATDMLVALANSVPKRSGATFGS